MSLAILPVQLERAMTCTLAKYVTIQGETKLRMLEILRGIRWSLLRPEDRVRLEGSQASVGSYARSKATPFGYPSHNPTSKYP